MEARLAKPTEKFQTLTEEKTPTYLYVADKPPALGGVISKMSPEEFMQMSGGMQGWTTTVRYPTNYVPVSNSTAMTKKAFQNMMTSIAKVDESLVIAYMNDTVKYGLFTLTTIPKDTWVLLYEGQYHLVQTREDQVKLSGAYSFAVDIDGKQLSDIISAESFGGKARFVQEAPKKTRKKNENRAVVSSLTDYVFNEGIDVKEVGHANLECHSLSYKGKRFLAYKTGDKEIPANQLLLIHYGQQFWIGINSVPRLFLKNGHMLEEGSYTATLISIKLYITPAHAENVIMTFTYDEWKELFKEGGGHSFYGDGDTDQALIFEEQMFDRAFATGKYEKAPFMVFDRPAVIAPLSTVRQYGIFACKEKASICTELYWITNIPGWKYNADKNVAFLVNKDESLIVEADKLLKSKGFDSKSGSSKQGPIIHVSNLNLKKLKECSKELEQERMARRKVI